MVDNLRPLSVQVQSENSIDCFDGVRLSSVLQTQEEGLIARTAGFIGHKSRPLDSLCLPDTVEHEKSNRRNGFHQGAPILKKGDRIVLRIEEYGTLASGPPHK